MKRSEEWIQWFGEVLSIGHLFLMSTPGQVGMLLKGGVSGGLLPHKRGPKAQPPKGKERVERREESETPGLGSLKVEDCQWRSRYLRYANVLPHFGTYPSGVGATQIGGVSGRPLNTCIYPAIPTAT